MRVFLLILVFVLGGYAPVTPPTPAAASVASIDTRHFAVDPTERLKQPMPEAVADRAKFPLTDPNVVDSMSLVNRVVNAGMTYEDDLAHYGEDEKWVTNPSDAKGDCDDYALTKMEILRQYGWDTLYNARVVTLRVKVIENGKPDLAGHAILEVRLSGGEVAYLDNNNNEVMTKAELVDQGYIFTAWPD
jgi:predicted transglutaminase-like cysteine proteinase